MPEFSGYGLWSLLVINAAIFIFFAASFTKTPAKRDWRALGAFSAFIVALFAEMYGFPLTLYLLSGWLSQTFAGVDFRTHDAGHLLEMMFGWRTNPHFGPFHIVSNILIFGGFWLLASSWNGLYAAAKDYRLAVDGPYAYVRHPQYDAFVIIMFGFLIQWPTLITLVMFPIMVAVYVNLARREEADAKRSFGRTWDAYAEAVPAFFPRPGGALHAPKTGGGHPND